MKELRRTLFGNPILREVARRLTPEEIRSDDIQQLIREMYEFLDSQPKFGVGLAAPQVGRGVAISVISTKPTPYRTDVKAEKLTIINPEVITFYGRKASMWEGCISFGTSTVDFPYAQTRRHKRIRLRYFDAQGKQQEADFEGLMAHVMQHETDHLNGILFVDRVKDTTSYTMKSEYVKQMKQKARHAKQRKNS